jgi:hypothetical protein
MKPVFKCDYCQFIGTEEEVSEHEPKCFDNYDRRSCYTCAHRGQMSMVNKLVKYECGKGIDVPEGKIYEFCNSYERKPKPDTPWLDATRGFFGGMF